MRVETESCGRREAVSLGLYGLSNAFLSRDIWKQQFKITMTLRNENLVHEIAIITKSK